jgi:hypothetical protein
MQWKADVYKRGFPVSMDAHRMQKAAFWRVYGVRSECELLNEGVCVCLRETRIYAVEGRCV